MIKTETFRISSLAPEIAFNGFVWFFLHFRFKNMIILCRLFPIRARAPHLQIALVVNQTQCACSSFSHCCILVLWCHVHWIFCVHFFITDLSVFTASESTENGALQTSFTLVWCTSLYFLKVTIKTLTHSLYTIPWGSSWLFFLTRSYISTISRPGSCFKAI